MADPQRLDMSVWLMRYFRERPRITAAYSSVILMFPIGSVVIPALLGAIADSIKDNKPIPLSIKISLGIMSLLLLGLSVAWFYLDAWIAADMTAELRKTIFSEVMRAYSHNYQALQVSSIIAKAINLPEAVVDVVRLWHAQIIPGLIILLCVGMFILWNDKKTGWGIFAAFISMAIAFWSSFYVCSDRVIEADYGNDSVQEVIGDSLENLMHVYLSNASDEEVQRFDRELERQNERYKNSRNCSNHFMSVIKFFIATLAILVVYSLIQRYWDDKQRRENNKLGANEGLTIGRLSAVFFTMMTSTHVIFNAIDAWPRSIFKTAQVQKTQTFFNDLADHARTPVSNAVSCGAPKTGLLVYHDVTFRYPDAPTDSLVMDGTTLAFQSTDRVRVVGHIGSGKSTLVTLALGLYDYQHGSVCLNGREVKSLSRSDIAKLITFVPQGPRLLNRTILENLMLGSNVSREFVQDKINTLKQEFEQDRHSNDSNSNESEENLDFLVLDKVVGKGGSKLSTGQRAMVCLLRALINNTPIVICDELTANLDHHMKNLVLKVIDRVCQGKLLVFITHDTSISDNWFNRKIELSAGKIIQDVSLE